MDKYLVQYMIEDELSVHLMTDEEIIAMLKTDNIAGFLNGIWIWDVSVGGEMKQLKTSCFWEPGPLGAKYVNDSDYYDMMDHE